MPRRFLLAASLAAALSGCVGNPNTLVFGTNTVFGISAGAGATSAPSLVVGYKRQEAVVMPLVASLSLNGETLTACTVAPVRGSPDHPCILKGWQSSPGNGSSEADSLSVMASFGTKYGASSDELNGEISQYFATGLAARRLAERSGPAAVATGTAASAVAALIGSQRLIDIVTSEQEGARAKVQEAAIAKDRQTVVDKVRSSVDFKLYLADAAKASRSGFFGRVCAGAATPDDCARRIEVSHDPVQPDQWQRAAATPAR